MFENCSFSEIHDVNLSPSILPNFLLTNFMKNIFPFLIACLFAAGCSHTALDKTTECPLPDCTAAGENTLGCLVNGRAYVCRADEGLPFEGRDNALRVETGPGGLPYFAVYTQDACSAQDTANRASIDLIFRLTPKNEVAYQHARYNASPGDYLCAEDGAFRYHDAGSARNFIKIVFFDAEKRIVSGEFEFDLYDPDCSDTIRLRKGRFDLAF